MPCSRCSRPSGIEPGSNPVPSSGAAVAAEAAMSVRSLNRRFKEQTGTTPLQWLLRARHRAPGQYAVRAAL
nr:helix-turn-helix domain-containing protein [Sorangium cellulosum]